MFDIDKQLRTWREVLLQREAFEADDVDELETHLRDEISRLVARGLSEEEAFGVALRRLGHTDMLDAEFGKVNGGVIWGRRLQWMLAGYLVVAFSGRMILALARIFASIGVAGGMKGPPIVAVYASVIVACVLALFYIVTRMEPHRPARAQLLGNRLRVWARSRLGAITIMTTAFLLVVGIHVLQYAPWLLMAHYLSLNEFGAFARGSSFVGFAGSVLGPLTVVGLMLSINRRNIKLAAGRN